MLRLFLIGLLSWVHLLEGCSSVTENPRQEMRAPITVPNQIKIAGDELVGIVKWIAKEIPARRTVNTEDRQALKLNNDAPIRDDSVLIGPDRGIANVFVYVSDYKEAIGSKPPTAVVQVHHQRCQFSPRVVGIQVGQKLVIENKDPIDHTEHFISEKQVEYGVESEPERVISKRFRAVEVFVRVRCDLHAWERCYVGVLDHPYFAVTDQSGRFRLPKGLPQGKYTLTAQHEALGSKSLSVTISGTAQIEPLQFEFSTSEK